VGIIRARAGATHLGWTTPASRHTAGVLLLRRVRFSGTSGGANNLEATCGYVVRARYRLQPRWDLLRVVADDRTAESLTTSDYDC
jgi:hypothetical protein